MWHKLRKGPGPLDKDLKAFKLLDRPLYDGYTQALQLLNSGGRGQEKSAAA